MFKSYLLKEKNPEHYKKSRGVLEKQVSFAQLLIKVKRSKGESLKIPQETEGYLKKMLKTEGVKISIATKIQINKS